MKTILLAILLLNANNVISQKLTPEQIIKKLSDMERIQSSESHGRQIIKTSSGKKRTLEFHGYSKDRNAKQLMEYISPKRVKGDKVLMLNDGDDIWFYTPKTDRVRHLASHARKQKVQGSDFSYEDMSAGNYEKDFTYTLLGEEEILDRLCYKFELIPTESGPSYSKLILWADKERFVTIQCHYYDEEDELLKRLQCHNIEKIETRWHPMRMVMTNLQEGGETVIENISIKMNVKLDDKLFTTNNLKKR